MKSKVRHHYKTTTTTIVARLTIGLLAGTLPAAARKPGEPTTDLLRFSNGDSLHGSFMGLDKNGSVRWNHPDAQDPMVLNTGKLRRIALNGGRPAKPHTTTSYTLLENGDRIPGRIVALDDKTLILESEMAGTITIPRKHVRLFAPIPYGGQVHYIGPFIDGEWSIVMPADKEEEADAEEEDEDLPEGVRRAPAPRGDEPPAPEEEEEEEAPWVFGGGAYYSNSQLPIAIDTHAPNKTRFQFTLAWRNRLNAIIAFHATMKPQKRAEDEDGGPRAGRGPVFHQGQRSTNFANTYGESYILTIYSNYAQLYRCTFDEDGNPEVDRVQTSSANLRLEEMGEAQFELRCDRDSGHITLYTNGRFVSQWEDLNGYAGAGSHLAFACQNSSSHLRVSDVVVTAWNGLIDSALSMEVGDRDIVLMANGTDRFSGEVRNLQNGTLSLAGTYATMEIPLTEVQEVRFAGSKLVELPAESDDALRLALQPLGRLTVTPREATRNLMKASHSAFGEVELDLDYAALLEFSYSNSVLDAWDNEF